MSSRFSAGSLVQDDAAVVMAAVMRAPAPGSLPATRSRAPDAVASEVADTGLRQSGVEAGASPGEPLSLPLDTSSLAAARHQAHTHQVPPHQRGAYWLDLMCSAFVAVDQESPPTCEFYGELSSLRLGSLTIGTVTTSSTRVRRTQERIRREPDSYYLIQIQREGTGVVCQDDRTAVLQPGDFALHDSTRPFELAFDSENHRVITLKLPCSALDIHVSNIQELTATTISGTSPAGRLLGSTIAMLARDLSRLPTSAALSLSEAIISLVAAGLRSLPTANLKRPSSLQAYHVGRVHAYVNQHLRDPDLSVGSIARAMEMSADHLSRIFKQEPMPLSRLIWQSRLTACTNDLSDPRMRHRTISEIAFAWGFNDAAHFSRAFKERHGVSPRKWRVTQDI